MVIASINWSLISGNDILITKKNIMVDSIKDIIIFNSSSEINELHINDKKFIRKTDEFEMEIDFIQKTCKFNFKEDGTCTFDIECLWKYKNNEYNLFYRIDDTEKNLKLEINV